MTGAEGTATGNQASVVIRNADHGTRLYRTMQLIRRFEERILELINSNEIASICHEYIGQEAIAVGVCDALRPSDAITSTHRGHGHILAKGGEPRRVLAELMGKATGYNKGKGGSMHIADLQLGIYGANGIVAAGVPIAAGAAWSRKVRGTDDVVVGFFGDGGLNQGVLHEVMNMAALWRLPVLFVCENNQYAVTTAIKDVSAADDLASHATPYGMPGVNVDGMDVEAVLQATSEAVARARRGDGPSLLVCHAYRYRGHHTAEGVMRLDYRTDEEIESWKARDAIERLARRMHELGHWRDREREAVVAEVEATLDEAIEFARRSPYPELDTAFEHQYATPYPGLPAKGWS
jgi:acetoin:2,6-dichlorophenolindophenol oxidoreductase subunit alpha